MDWQKAKKLNKVYEQKVNNYKRSNNEWNAHELATIDIREALKESQNPESIWFDRMYELINRI